jgi:hypothetical protein
VVWRAGTQYLLRAWPLAAVESGAPACSIMPLKPLRRRGTVSEGEGEEDELPAQITGGALGGGLRQLLDSREFRCCCSSPHSSSKPQVHHHGRAFGGRWGGGFMRCGVE